MKHKKSVIGVIAVMAIIVSTMVALAVSASATKPDPGHKVTICHATPPDTAANGYVRITVDVASVGFQHSGHQDQHDADIIPPYTQGNFSYPGKNWDQAGQAIWNNNCGVATGTIQVHKAIAGDKDAADPNTEYQIHVRCTLDSEVVYEDDLALLQDTSSDAVEVQAGSVCDATEDPGVGAIFTWKSDGPVTITADGESVVTITNTFATPETPVTPAPEVVAGESVVEAPVVAPAAVQATPRTTG